MMTDKQRAAELEARNEHLLYLIGASSKCSQKMAGVLHLSLDLFDQRRRTIATDALAKWELHKQVLALFLGSE